MIVDSESVKLADMSSLNRVLNIVHLSKNVLVIQLSNCNIDNNTLDVFQTKTRYPTLINVPVFRVYLQIYM